MAPHVHVNDNGSHTHGAGIQLEPEAQAILARGLAELVERTNGLEFRTSLSSRYALPLSLAIYGEVPASTPFSISWPDMGSSMAKSPLAKVTLWAISSKTLRRVCCSKGQRPRDGG